MYLGINKYIQELFVQHLSIYVSNIASNRERKALSWIFHSNSDMEKDSRK